MNIVVLISGYGSNLQAIIDVLSFHTSMKIAAVISDNPEAYGLKRASQANIKTEIIPGKNFCKQDFELQLTQALEKYRPDLIVLAGFMQIIPPSITKAYATKMINIHPSLLPKYPGLKTHERVLDNKERQHGCTVHFVDEHIDHGPIIAKAVLEVYDDDDCLALSKRVQTLEHYLYPKVITWFVDQRIELEKGVIFLDGKPLSPEGKTFFFAQEDIIDAELF